MGVEIAMLAAGLAAVAAVAGVVALVVVMRQAAAMQRLRLLAEQALAGQRGEAETLRATLAATERALTTALASSGGQLRGEVAVALGELGRSLTEQGHATAGALRGELAAMRGELAQQATALREGNEKKLAEIQASVNEQLHAAVEKQMTASFARVADQFTALQKAMGDVTAVTAQIGDIKRLFGNVKTRGGWGEAQVRAMLDDILPDGAYDTNWKPRADSDDAVEFAVIMPMRGEFRPRLPIDAKFPVEDYERMLAAADLGDGEAERAARRGLEARVRGEARKMAAKYISPPATVDFAVMYVPTDGIYTEIARIPGLINELNAQHRVLVLGPSLFPALLRTIHLGHMTLTLEQKSADIGRLLGATRTEMAKMDDVLGRLSKQAGTISNTINAARQRTRAVERTLRSVEAVDAADAALLIGPVDEVAAEAEESGV